MEGRSMKKSRTIMSIALAIALVMTSAEFTFVFAIPDPSTPETPTAPEAVKNLTAESGYNSVKLMWDKDENATEYVVTGGASPQTVKTNTCTVGGLDPYTNYTFTVKAKNAEGESPAVSVSKSPVRDIQYKIKIKQGGTLKSHAGKKAKIKVKSGQTLYAYGFAGGRYILRHNGSVFFVKRTRVGKKSSIYSNKKPYTRQEAQNYVNARGLSSKTNSLVWVNTYSQRLYLFNGTKGNWTCVDDWKISTGTASTPTPTSISGIKKINKRKKTRHGIKWWSFFHGTAALHGVKSNWGKKLGNPASNGCIRNPVAKAKVVYNQGKGTRVVIY